MPEFINDDAGYIAWVRNNPLGYVVVSHNPPHPNYISLHRADCPYINPDKAPHKQNWTKSYIKACATTVDGLVEWATGRFGKGPWPMPPCKHCRNAGRL